MSVDRIDFGYRVDMVEGRRTQRSRAEESGGRPGDTVTISDKARELAAARTKEMAPEDAVKPTENEDFPLESYRMPDWYMDLLGGYSKVTVQLGQSWEEGGTKYEKLDPADQRLFDEYAAIVTPAYREEMDKIGVLGDHGKYYHEFLENPENQRTVRNALYDRLKNNPRAMELMQYFGISMPQHFVPS